MPTADITLISYNIHHGAGMDRRIDLERIAGVILDAGAHIVCLQEVDCKVVRSRRAHQPRVLARLLGMHAVYGVTLRWPAGQRFGNLLLTSLPLEETRTHLLPGRAEQRGLIEARLATPAGPVTVFDTHWGLPEDDRVQQARRTIEIMRAAHGPVLLAGDLNEGPEGPDHVLLRGAGFNPLGPDDLTYPADVPVATIDHVYGSSGPDGSPGWSVRDAYTIPSLASDHRPVVVDLILG